MILGGKKGEEVEEIRKKEKPEKEELMRWLNRRKAGIQRWFYTHITRFADPIFLYFYDPGIRLFKSSFSLWDKAPEDKTIILQKEIFQVP